MRKKTPKTKGKSKKPKPKKVLSMDERIKAALAETNAIEATTESLEARKSALSEELQSMSEAMTAIEEKFNDDRVTSDDLNNAASNTGDSYGSEFDAESIRCYLEGKHGC